MIVQKFNDFVLEKMKIIPINNDELDKISEYKPNELYLLKNPKLSDLKCFDILETKQYYYIFLTNDCGKSINNIKGWLYGNGYDAFRIENYYVSSLGMNNFTDDLKCRTNNTYDITNVYRGLNPEKCYKMNFYEIYDEMKEKLCDIKK